MRVAAAWLIASTLLFMPAVSSAAYGPTRWGMGVREVRMLFPGGTLSQSDAGDETYRVTARAFDTAPAIATFAFHPVHRLNAVMFEFPAAGTFDATKQDYARPTSAHAAGLSSSLSRVLNAKYGPPAHENQGPGGRIKVWRGRDDFARMQVTVVADGCEDVRLWIETSSKLVDLTSDQKHLEDVFNSTAPESWSRTGAMRVRWGMGPADVRKVYPGLRSSPGILVEPTKAFSVDSYVEGQVGITFDFFRGRLFSLTVSELTHSQCGLLRGTFTDDQYKEWEDRQDFWRRQVHDILVEKYGEPLVSPTAEEFKAATANDSGLDDLAWRWRSDDMSISLIRRNARIVMLRYDNIGVLGREAWKAERAHREALESERKEKF